MDHSTLSMEAGALLWGQFLLLVGVFVGVIKEMRQNIKDREDK